MKAWPRFDFGFNRKMNRKLVFELATAHSVGQQSTKMPSS